VILLYRVIQKRLVLLAKYNLKDQVEEDGMGGACSPNGETGNVYRLLVGKGPLRRPKRMWVDNIKMDLG
jgi:hypothetical protein